MSIRPRAGSASAYANGVDLSDSAGQNSEGPSTAPAPEYRPHRFIHIQKLLSALLTAILDDPDEYLIGIFVALFIHLCDDVARKGVPLEPILALEINAMRSFQCFLRQPGGILVCVSSQVEQLEFGGDIRGMNTNLAEEQDALGPQMPTLNSALCSCYENTFTDEYPSPDVSQQRGQVGSLIAITWMHEILGRKGELGWEFEFLIFRGVIQARWCAADTAKENSFEFIQDVWLQLSRFANFSSPLRVILPRGDSDTSLNLYTILECFAWTPEPEVPRTTVISEDCVLRGIPIRSTRIKPVLPPLGFFGMPHCGLALECMTQQ
ncbi:hypothetical protein B0H19DRAFT_1271796 [Mycena capillaripes]|nr:hypothetical protein B0H19DRAFT_1271796 [Mycena capillaripes]